jgi:hypothetical protein
VEALMETARLIMDLELLGKGIVVDKESQALGPVVAAVEPLL